VQTIGLDVLIAAFTVVGLGSCLAALAPHSGRIGFLRNLALCIGGLCLLMYIGAVIGSTLHDFMLER
jgi:hypothetical protein